jgi:hypothetical protein
MPRSQRFTQYIRELAYTEHFKPDERDERPDDVLARETAEERQVSAWSATSYLGYVPFRVDSPG